VGGIRGCDGSGDRDSGDPKSCSQVGLARTTEGMHSDVIDVARKPMHILESLHRIEQVAVETRVSGAILSSQP
jgi:hypothetical protein